MLDKGYYEYAEKIYDVLLELSPSSSSAMYNKGLAIFNLGRYEQSISVFEQVINLNKDYIAEAYTSKATALEYLNRPGDAKQFYDLATNEYSARIKNLTKEAESLQKSGDYIKSINHIEKILTLEPNNKDGLYLKSFALFNLGRYEESIPVFEKYIENDPNNINVLSHYGRAYLSLNENDDALKIFNKVIEIAPENSDARYYRGLSLYNLQQYSEAAKSFEEAINFDPKNSDALTKLHDIYSNYLFEKDEALKISKLLDKSTFENKAALVEDLIKTQNYEEAIKHAKEIEEKIPYQQTEGQCIIRFLLLAAYLLQGNLRKGIIELNKFFEYYTGIGDTGFKIRDTWSFRGLTDFIDNGNAHKKSKDMLTNVMKLLKGVEGERVLVRMNNILADSNVKMGQENRRVKKIAIPTIAAATGIAILFGVYIIYIASLGNLQLEPHCGKLDLPRFVDVNEPNALSLNPKTQDVYVASSTGSISVISCKEYQNSEGRNLGSLNSGTYAFAQDDDLVYVANSKNNTISVYNWTDSRNSVKTENVGSGPTGIAVDNSTHLVYVANSKDNTISVYNSKNDTVKAVNVGLGPTSIAVDPVTHLVYVANSKDNTISVYNSKDGSVETVKVGLEPTGIAVNPVTHLVYVAIGNNSDTILVIDGKDKRHIKPIRNVTVGPNKIGIPKSISIDEKKNIIYVANNKSNTISVIDGGNNTIINTINTLNISPADIEIDPKLNALYIATKDLKSGQVILINNPASYRPHIGFSLVQVGKEPTGIAVDNSTHLVYVANSKDNTISVYNSKNDTVKTRKVGLGPTSIAVDPVTHLVYVANSKNNTISVYNSKDGSVETVKVGANSSTQVTGNTLNNIYGNATGEGGPTSIAVNPSTHLVYVANSEDNTISVIHRNKNNTLVEEKARIKVGSHPEQIVVDAKKDLVYVSNSEGDTISIIGVRDNKSNLLGSIFSSDDPIGFALDSTNNKLIVANNRLNTISIIQLSPGIETASYLPYLLTRVQGAPETQASKQASKQGAPEIGDQDSKLGEVRSIISLPSGGHPHSIAMDKNILYVTNSAHNTILIKNMSKESLEEEQMSAFKFGQMGR